MSETPWWETALSPTPRCKGSSCAHQLLPPPRSASQLPHACLPSLLQTRKSLKRLPNLVSPTVSKQFPQEARSMHPTLLRDLSPPVSSPVFLTRYVLWLCNPYSLWRLSIPWCRHPHPSPRSSYNLVLDFHPLNSFRVLRSASKSVHGYNLVLHGIRFARQRLLLFSKYQTANAIPHGRLMQGCTYHRAFAIPSTYAQELSTCSWHGSKATQLPSHSL